jgi:hypothetical protein
VDPPPDGGGEEVPVEEVETPPGTEHRNEQLATGTTQGVPHPITRQSSGDEMTAYKVPGGAEAVAREEAEAEAEAEESAPEAQE